MKRKESVPYKPLILGAKGGKELTLAHVRGERRNLLDESLGRFFFEMGVKNASKVILRDDFANQEFTWEELLHHSLALAAGFHFKLALKRGDKLGNLYSSLFFSFPLFLFICPFYSFPFTFLLKTFEGVWLPNGKNWIMTQVATSLLGIVLVNLNPAYQLTELSHALKIGEVNALLLSPRFRATNYTLLLNQLLPFLSSLPPSPPSPLSSLSPSPPLFPQLNWLILDEKEGEGEERKEEKKEERKEEKKEERGFWSFSSLFLYSKLSEIKKELLENVFRHSMKPEQEIINIQYTSATTGAAKPSLLTSFNILSHAFSFPLQF